MQMIRKVKNIKWNMKDLHNMISRWTHQVTRKVKNVKMEHERSQKHKLKIHASDQKRPPQDLHNMRRRTKTKETSVYMHTYEYICTYIRTSPVLTSLSCLGSRGLPTRRRVRPCKQYAYVCMYVCMYA